MAFVCRPEIARFERIDDFMRSCAVGAGDLILSNRYTFDAAAHPAAGAQFIWQEDYGAGEPNEEMVSAIVAAARPARRVIAIGGGTVLDIGKILALDAAQADLYALFSGARAPVKARELILAPTTCGTGSEVTNVAVVAFPDKGVKLGLADAALYADRAMLVPEFLSTLPFRPFAYSAIDALVHAMEAYLSPRRDAFTRLFSTEAMRALIGGFSRIAENGAQARGDVLADFQLAACQAGLAFGNAGCGAVHAMSYPVGAQFHIAHGEVNYALLTPVLRFYESVEPDCVAELKAQLAALMRVDCEQAFAALESLLARVIPGKKLSAYGMTREQIALFTQRVVEKQQRLLKNSPIRMDAARIAAAYEIGF